MKSEHIVKTVLLVCLAEAACHGDTLSAAPLPVLKVSISNLRKFPARYSGKVVQIRGKLDECAEWECSICPEEMTSETADPKKCASLEFRSLLAGTGFGEEAKDAVFRFASVILNAKFDPGCWKVPCLDRASVLDDADVVAVTARHNGRTRLWLGKRTPLIPMSDPAATEVMKAAYKAGLPRAPSSEEKNPELAKLMLQFDPSVKVFGISGQPDSAVACWGAHDSGVEDWPNSEEGALEARSVNDIYRCAKFRRVEGQWFAQVRPLWG